MRLGASRRANAVVAVTVDVDASASSFTMVGQVKSGKPPRIRGVSCWRNWWRSAASTAGTMATGARRMARPSPKSCQASLALSIQQAARNAPVEVK